MKKRMIGVLAAVALGGAGLLAAVSAQAGDETMRVTGATRHAHPVVGRSARSGTEIRSVTVAYGDLDIADKGGAETLYRRLQVGSRQVCSPQEDTRSLGLAAHWKECYAGALDDAVAKVGDLRVTQLHREKTGRDVAGDAQVAGTR